MSELPFHPLANLFPPMTREAFDRLVADISSDGLREAIVMHENKILDGRNRYRACLQARVAPRFRNFNPSRDVDDPIAFVISKNLPRWRHHENQCALAAARLSAWLLGEGADPKPSADLRKASDAQAAQLMNVSLRHVRCARKVLTRGTPALLDVIERGRIRVLGGGRIARWDPHDQNEFAGQLAKRASAEGALPPSQRVDAGEDRNSRPIEHPDDSQPYDA